MSALKVKGNLLRLFFGANLLLFVSSIFLPLAGVFWSLHIETFREEVYWSFQAVSYVHHDVFSGRYEKTLWLWDFWFSREMIYRGLSLEWSSLFIFQVVTLFSGVWVVMRKWQKTSNMLAPTSFSLLSAYVGTLITNRLLFGVFGFQGWGFSLTIISGLGFLLLFLTRRFLEKRKRKKAEEEEATPILL